MMISRDMLQDIQRFKDCPDTPLHQAAYDGDLAELQLHLKDKNLALKINDRNRLGCSPLRLAASENRRDVVKFLIKNGADIDLSDVKTQTPLHVAVKKQHAECIEELLEAGANPNGDQRCTHTPLYLAAREGRLEIVKMLVKHGAQLDLSSSFTIFVSTPLHVSVVYRNLDVFRFLLQSGAKPDANSFGCEIERYDSFLLYHAAVKYNSDISFAQLLYDFGAMIHQRDDRGKLAYELGDNECSQFIKSLFDSPRTLMSHCRIAIRRALGQYRLHQIATLQLPSKIRSYLQHD